MATGHRVMHHEIPSRHEAFSWYFSCVRIEGLGLLNAIGTALSRNPVPGNAARPR